jgi:hypothetical protein
MRTIADLKDYVPAGLHYWWLSFVDRTEDNSVACHLGVTIVTCHGDDIGRAVQEAWDYHCNPGGEVLGLQLKDIPVHSIPRNLTYRLLTDPGEIAEAQIAIDTMEPEVRP